MKEKNTSTITQRKYYAKSLEDVLTASRRALANLDAQITKAEGGYYILNEKSIFSVFKIPIKLKIDCSNRSDGRVEVRITVKKEGMNILRNPKKIIDRIFNNIDRYFMSSRVNE